VNGIHAMIRGPTVSVKLPWCCPIISDTDLQVSKVDTFSSISNYYFDFLLQILQTKLIRLPAKEP